MNTQPPNHNRTLVNVPLERTTEIPCPQCGNLFFYQVMILRRIPALYSPTRKDEMAPVEALECAKCHSVLDLSRPMPEKRRKGLKIVQTILQIVQTVAPYFQKKR